VLWESVSWRRGEDQFRFDIERGGLFATLSAPGNRSLTLPMVVWEGLLDALKASRSTRTRSEQQYPSRARARWYDGEAGELADGFKSGRTIAQLARAHNRTEYAIEHQLDRLGLISKAHLYGPGRGAENAGESEGRRSPPPDDRAAEEHGSAGAHFGAPNADSGL
jgi:hypothetical protein